jgi:hypothetical protein
MSYNIDITYNVLKHGNIEQTGNIIKTLAEESCCENYYDNYEFERNICIQRNHYVITVKFASSINLINFLKKVKKIKYLHVETIYQENIILYVSTYYLTQMMDKQLVKQFKKNKNDRIFTKEETVILNALNNA